MGGRARHRSPDPQSMRRAQVGRYWVLQAARNGAWRDFGPAEQNSGPGFLTGSDVDRFNRAIVTSRAEGTQNPVLWHKRRNGERSPPVGLQQPRSCGLKLISHLYDL